jgi:ribose transport system permease protein
MAGTPATAPSEEPGTVAVRPTGRDGAGGQALRAGLALVRTGPVLILVLLALAFWALEPLFLTERNVRNVLVQSSVIAALALGQLLVILTRGIDLSVGSVVALSTVVGALVFRDVSAAGAPVILAMLLCGLACGLVNGLVFVKGRVPHPFIVTLAMLSVARGLALMLSDGSALPGMPDAVVTAGSGRIGAVPVPPLIVLAIGLVLLVLTTRLVWGRWIYAVGGDPQAAREVGVPVNAILISVYAISGLTAGAAAVITAGRTNSGFPTAANLAELDAIAAVIIGGASFFGGRGSVVNALVGALIVGVIRNGLNIMGVEVFVQYVVVGVVLVLAVQLDVLRTRLEARLQAAEARSGGG